MFYHVCTKLTNIFSSVWFRRGQPFRLTEARRKTARNGRHACEALFMRVPSMSWFSRSSSNGSRDAKTGRAPWCKKFVQRVRTRRRGRVRELLPRLCNPPFRSLRTPFWVRFQTGRRAEPRHSSRRTKTVLQPSNSPAFVDGDPLD